MRQNQRKTGWCHSLRGSVDWNNAQQCCCDVRGGHSLRGSVDWNILCNLEYKSSIVTPFAGVWIEILACSLVSTCTCMSLPSRECGLKLLKYQRQKQSLMSLPSRECGLKYLRLGKRLHHRMSLPSRECGLKYICRNLPEPFPGHSLRGSVDWNIDLLNYQLMSSVTPFAGVWIEILCSSKRKGEKYGHSLRGSVDWNMER